MLLFLLSATLCVGKSYFRVNSRVGAKEIIVNGKLYHIDSTYTKIETLFPKFDRLSFKEDDFREDIKVYCNFKSDSSYTLIGACCGSTDIVSSWKARIDVSNWKIVTDTSVYFDMEMAKAVLMDKPVITLKVINASLKDSIYGWYSDHSCFPSFKLLDDKGWKYGTPVKCFYWNNISPFVFFKSKQNFSASTKENGVVEGEFPDVSDVDSPNNKNYQELGVIYIRLFDDESYNIIFDNKTQKVMLTHDSSR